MAKLDPVHMMNMLYQT